MHTQPDIYTENLMLLSFLFFMNIYSLHWTKKLNVFGSVIFLILGWFTYSRIIQSFQAVGNIEPALIEAKNIFVVTRACTYIF